MTQATLPTDHAALLASNKFKVWSLLCSTQLSAGTPSRENSLFSGEQDLNSRLDVAEKLRLVRLADPSGEAVIQFYEDLLVNAPCAVPLCDWDATAMAYWGWAVLDFAEVIYTVGLETRVRRLVKMVHENLVADLPRGPVTEPVLLALAALWAALADTYGLGLNPKVYAAGQSAVAPDNGPVFIQVKLAL